MRRRLPILVALAAPWLISTASRAQECTLMPVAEVLASERQDPELLDVGLFEVTHTWDLGEYLDEACPMPLVEIGAAALVHDADPSRIVDFVSHAGASLGTTRHTNLSGINVRGAWTASCRCSIATGDEAEFASNVVVVPPSISGRATGFAFPVDVALPIAFDAIPVGTAVTLEALNIEASPCGPLESVEVQVQGGGVDEMFVLDPRPDCGRLGPALTTPITFTEPGTVTVLAEMLGSLSNVVTLTVVEAAGEGEGEGEGEGGGDGDDGAGEGGDGAGGCSHTGRAAEGGSALAFAVLAAVIGRRRR